MPTQIDYSKINRRALDLLLSTKKHTTSVNKRLKALIEIRVSQINGCAYCVDLHSTEARELGENQQRLDCLPVWKESQLFGIDEMVALDWAENVTNISIATDIHDKLEVLLQHYSEPEVVDITFVVAVINSLNRLAISLGDKPSIRNQ
ncbi:MAG: AhpD family alkylhydroperoxidase [Parasphingorhabdus sp.]|jgi:AhpD family alkylhydroperoxidase